MRKERRAATSEVVIAIHAQLGANAEAGEMERDLWIGGTVAGFSGSDGLRLAEPIDLHHPGHDMPARRLPHDTGGKTAGERQRAEEGEAPVPCLNTRGANIRVDHTDEDASIADMIRAATHRFDGRDGSLGLCLITQSWTLTLDAFTAELAIPLPPCQSIDAITYVDPDGATQTLDAGAYQVFGLGSADGAKVRPAYGTSWPAFRHQPKMRVGHLYENRESVVIGTGYNTETPDGPEDFVRNFRTWTF
ncbi:MAG: hypothetical protein B7Z15_19565 [Rhizobiales bacterium 32-66-8]|nr:MAG: hypothetical protein B7Z15_19565 [Rhizobiales bacterium 32-66-8]